MYQGILRTPLVTLSKFTMPVEFNRRQFPIVKEQKSFIYLKLDVSLKKLVVELAGIEPTTSWLQTRRSPS